MYKLKGWLKSRRAAQKALRWNILFLFDVHAVLFTGHFWVASSIKVIVKQTCFNLYDRTRKYCKNFVECSIVITWNTLCAVLARLVCRTFVPLVSSLRVKDMDGFATAMAATTVRIWSRSWFGQLNQLEIMAPMIMEMDQLAHLRRIFEHTCSIKGLRPFITVS